MPEQELTANDASGLEDIPPGSHLQLRSGLIIGAAVSLALYLAFLLTGGGAEIFQQKITIRTFMADASGLAKGAPVRLNGVAIGKIHSLGLSDSRDPRRVAVIEMRVQARFLNKIPADSVATVSADNLLGDQYIDIQAGRAAAAVEPNGELASLDQNLFNGRDIVMSMEAVLKRVDELLTQIERGDTRLGRFFHEETFYETVRLRISDIQAALTRVESPAGPAGQMFFHDDLYRRMHDPVMALAEQLEALQRGEGPAGQMLANSSQYDTLLKNLSDLRHSLEQTNQSPALRDDAPYANALAALNAWGRALDAANRGQGPMGPLLANTQLYDTLNGTSKTLRSELGDFRRNPQKYLRLKVF